MPLMMCCHGPVAAAGSRLSGSVPSATTKLTSRTVAAGFGGAAAAAAGFEAAVGALVGATATGGGWVATGAAGLAGAAVGAGAGASARHAASSAMAGPIVERRRNSRREARLIEAIAPYVRPYVIWGASGAEQAQCSVRQQAPSDAGRQNAP